MGRQIPDHIEVGVKETQAHPHGVDILDFAQIAAVEQVWTRDGWADRFGLDLPDGDTGYGHSPAEAAKVRASGVLLAGYYHAVHKLTLAYLATVNSDDLAAIVDRRWDPPVTAGVRVVSTIDYCAQHLGQAAYLRGIAPLN